MDTTPKAQFGPTPCLSIGLPVYNGELYLSSAIGSILAQNFTDYELIIVDNASTDTTAEISQAFAARDPRVRYYRNPDNIGAADNFNRAFQLARGRYFKWSAHDDVLDPTFLEKCIAILENDPTIVLCYSRACRINEAGERVGTYDYEMAVSDSSPYVRFHDLIMTQHFCIAIFGVVRREVLAKTPLIQKYVGSDRNLIAELALHGRLYEIDEYLFDRRDHALASTRAFGIYKRLSWFDPKRARRLHFPAWRVGVEYARSVLRAPLPLAMRWRLLRLTFDWFIYRRKALREDLKAAAVQLFPSSLTLVRRFRRWVIQSRVPPQGS
jgi:glycosyltransferase involved in cell wall biosynthesis